MNAKKDNQPLHYAITRNPDYTFKIGKESARTVPELVEKVEKRLGFIQPCSGFPFQNIFTSLNTETILDKYSEFCG